jgi:hypothetical protein
MFRWQKDMTGLEVPPRKVLKVFRSLSDVQVALPGFPSQLATAYVVSFAAGKGVQTAVALNLATSLLTAFYFHDRKDVLPREAEDVFEEGIRFAESMGFMLGDLDWQLLDAGDREDLWDSFPLGPKKSPPAPAPAPERPARSAAVEPASSPAPERPARPVAAGPVPAAALRPPADPARENRTLPLDLEARRNRLRETIGRFLASL